MTTWTRPSASSGPITWFVLRKLREASGPLTSRDLADMWCEDRGLNAKASTVSMLRKRLGATLLALHHKGLVRQDGHVAGLIGWRITT